MATRSSRGVGCKIRCVRFDFFDKVQFHVLVLVVWVWAKEDLQPLELLALKNVLKIQPIVSHRTGSADGSELWQDLAEGAQVTIDPKDPLTGLSTMFALRGWIS